jgi:dipeptidyl aminopeptidase/acylaminoacyl peptidase
MHKTLLAALVLLAQDAKVREKKDVAYHDGKDADARKHKLDLYLPETDKPFPVMMWIHGGGWKAGDRALYGELGRRFAEAGIGCAVISYRLSPAVQHPEHVKDCARAFAWLHARVKEHGGNPERLFVSGQSAGGHLTALLTLDRKYLEELKVPEDAIKGSIPMSGVYTIPAVKRDVPVLKMFKDSFGSDEEVCKDASPTSHAKKAKAPMLVISEENDDFGGIQESKAAFKRALEEAKFKDVTFLEAKDRNHFSIVTKMMAKGEDPQRAAMVKFIRERCAELDRGK